MPPEEAWWRSAAIYQVYLRSFADGNGDGVGDLAGLRSRLPYLAGLGIDAIWVFRFGYQSHWVCTSTVFGFTCTRK